MRMGFLRKKKKTERVRGSQEERERDSQEVAGRNLPFEGLIGDSIGEG